MRRIYKNLAQDDKGDYFIVDKRGKNYINTQQSLLLAYLIEVLIAK